jgi:hypothetical protein
MNMKNPDLSPPTTPREVVPHEASHGDHTHGTIAQAAADAHGKGQMTDAHAAAGAARREEADSAAVRSGVLPPKPEVFDSSIPPSDTPVSAKDKFSQQFDGMKPGEIRYSSDGKTYRFDVAADGTQTRSFEDLENHTSQEEVIHPDHSTELTVGGRGSLETTQWDASGKLKSDTLNKDRTADGKFNYSDERNWYQGQLRGDYARWQDKSGQFHENQMLKMDDGTTIVRKMDGDRTDTKTTRPDGSWDDEVKQMNVDKVDPETGKHYKTMTIDRTEGKGG